VLAAQGNIHIIAANDDLFPLLYKFAVNDPRYHDCFFTAPAYRFDFLYFICKNQHII